MQTHSFTEEELELANQILQQIGEQVIGADPLVEAGDDWLFGTSAPDRSEQPLTLDRLAEAARLMASMSPLVTDIWFVDRTAQYGEFLCHRFTEKSAFSPTIGGLWAIDGIHLHDCWSSEFVPSAPAWCNHPGIWIEYNNGDCWRLEDVAKMGARGWFARRQREYDDWRQRATRFIHAMPNRIDQLGVDHPRYGKMKRATDIVLELLALPIDFGPRPAGETPSIYDELGARAMKNAVESLALVVAVQERLRCDDERWR